MDSALALILLCSLLDSVLPKSIKGVLSSTQTQGESEDYYSTIMNENKECRILLIQGDIAIKISRSSSNGLWKKSTDGKVYVPYKIGNEYNSDEVTAIVSAMNIYSTLTCIQFTPQTSENDFISISSSDGCWSYIGMQGGAQEVSIQKGGCVTQGIILHELNHAIGFAHEHCRNDRDNYVEIMYRYISPGDVINFDKMETNNIGLMYDYLSIMHYAPWMFSNTTGKNTIVPTPNPNVPIGMGSLLTNLDIAKINKLYGCDFCSSVSITPSGTITSPNYQNAQCVWLIQTPSGQVSMKFNAFAIQSSSDCTSNYIRIYDGPSRSSTVLLDKECGMNIPPPVISSTNQMLVEFISDNSQTGSGFTASYNTDFTDCDQLLFGSQFNLLLRPPRSI
ncbi:hypothetical protein GDO86_008816 [Hymenochirus boettgeri]|uniref:Metalloendopeptidase n=1 Tax=Hymenochirus boettgeri TaxID=247094 RepID=A0A8T2J374_9PIPI|nr:hypothetical protein GDO86_008816 [Hymenochirus boettgeri]